jgi:hypothetical protein
MDQAILMDLVRRAKDEGKFTVSGENYSACLPNDEEVLFLASQRVIFKKDAIRMAESVRDYIEFRYIPEYQEFEVVIDYVKRYSHSFVVKAKGAEEAEAEAMELAGNFDFNQCVGDGDYEVVSVQPLG